ncbi:MAG: hypothetical protein JST04_04155 [Bdellovibrionales bacterium]|nr:hypothetical protein [Bdellovibrionales bacterium]
MSRFAALFAFAVLVFGSLAAEAAPAQRGGPLLRLRQASGFVPRPLAKSLDCRVYADHVAIERNFAGVKVEETRAMTIDTGAIYSLIGEAKKAKLETTRGPVDGPFIAYEGFLILPADGLETVTLSSLNGGTGEMISNPSESAQILKNVLDGLCQ